MVRKKKLTGYLKLSLSLLFMLLFVNSYTTCNAQVYYNITGENLQRIYDFAKQQNIDLFPQTLSTEYNNLVDRWNILDTYKDDLNIRWDYIADQLEFYLYNTYSGDTNTQYYGEDNLLVFFLPVYNNTTSYNFYFVPYNWRILKIIEETRTTSSGEVYFLHSLYESDINGSGVVYKNMGVFLRITTSGDYYFYNDMQSYWSNIQSAYGNTYKTKYSWYKDGLWTYAYGILGLYNNNSLIGNRQKMIFYRPPNTSGNVLYQNWYNMNVNTNYVAAGDNFEEPTPTPEPTGDGGGDSSGLIENISESINSVPSGDDFSTPTSGELIDALNVPDIHQYSSVQATDNFWLSLWNNLYTYLTIENYRFYTFSFLGRDLTLDNDDMIITNETIANIVQKICIVGYVVVEYKIIRKIANLLSSGVISQIMHAYSKIDISDLF